MSFRLTGFSGERWRSGGEYRLIGIALPFMEVGAASCSEFVLEKIFNFIFNFFIFGVSQVAGKWEIEDEVVIIHCE